MWAGHVDAGIAALQAEVDKPEGKAAVDEIHYLATNKQRIRFDSFRASGHAIGSSTVESARKRLIAARIRESGVIWAQQGGRTILTPRAELLSNRREEARRDTRRLSKAA